MSNAISLQTIADAAGVTRTTVSLALRHNPRISAQTGEKIRSLARNLGYRPNADLSRIMRGIRTQQSQAILPRLALAHEGSCDREWIDAFRRACETHGYCLEDLGSKPLGGARLGQILNTRGISALLITHANALELIQSMDCTEFCVCVVSETPLGHHRIDPRHADPEWIAGEAVELLDQLLRQNRYGVPACPKVIRQDQCVPFTH
jgi:DNA-binding LacI/PurR family transcriptional regulator